MVDQSQHQESNNFFSYITDTTWQEWLDNLAQYTLVRICDYLVSWPHSLFTLLEGIINI